MTDEEAKAYERAVLEQAIEALSGPWQHGLIGRVLSVGLRGTRPDARIVIRYASHWGGEYEGDWAVWDREHRTSGGAWNAPIDQATLIGTNWEDGSIRAEGDPGRRG